MAKKFGGKFSPDGQGGASVREAVVDARKVDAAGAKAWQWPARCRTHGREMPRNRRR